MKKLRLIENAPVKMLAGLSLGIVSLLGAGSAFASYTAVIGGSAESGATYVNFDSITPPSTTTYTSGALSVLFTPNAEAVSGSGITGTDNGGAAAPWLSGNNNVNFGAATTGGDTTTYVDAGNVVAGGSSGKLTFNFSSGETYFGLLWGSIDLNNTLTLWSGANGTGSIVEQITGADLEALTTAIDDGGSQQGDTFDASGTAYVNVNTATPFESVVATTGTFTFEIDNVAYSGAVPDGGMTICLLGGALVGLQAVRRKLIR